MNLLDYGITEITDRHSTEIIQHQLFRNFTKLQREKYWI